MTPMGPSSGPPAPVGWRRRRSRGGGPNIATAASSTPGAPREAPCPVCGSWSRRTVYGGLVLDATVTALHRCRVCRNRYISPRRTGDDLLHQYVDPKEQERYYREEYAPIVPAVVRNTGRTVRLLEAFTPPGTLLDYGSWVGVMAAAAAARGWHAIGFDVSPSAARWGRELLGTRVVDDWGKVVASDLAPFDVVALLEVVEHLEDPATVLRRALEVLRPGGTLVLSTPNFASLGRARRRERWPHIYPAQHILYFTPSTLRALMRDCGVRPLRTYTWSAEVARLSVLPRWPAVPPDPPGGPALLAFGRMPRAGREPLRGRRRGRSPGTRGLDRLRARTAAALGRDRPDDPPPR
jgi:2-polyprenyl-3-methyl-5-hydroxy-6-metoxy-1,4-benzoquinol methylase